MLRDANPIQVDVVSDLVCPWCFIGQHRLAEALARWRQEHPQGAATVRWHPFQLNPETSPAGDPYLPYLERKFGGADAVKRVWDRVREAGAAAGIDFAFERIALRPNTLKAHRLIHRAQRRGDAAALVERLFAGHFQRGEDIGDTETLVRIAVESGDGEADVRPYLQSDQDADAVLGAIARASELGIGGVPFFIFNQRVGVSGAQPAEVLARALQESLGQP